MLAVELQQAMGVECSPTHLFGQNARVLLTDGRWGLALTKMFAGSVWAHTRGCGVHERAALVHALLAYLGSANYRVCDH